VGEEGGGCGIGFEEADAVVLVEEEDEGAVWSVGGGVEGGVGEETLEGDLLWGVEGLRARREG